MRTQLFDGTTAHRLWVAEKLSERCDRAHCNADRGEWCRTRNGNVTRTPHQTRVQAVSSARVEVIGSIRAAAVGTTCPAAAARLLNLITEHPPWAVAPLVADRVLRILLALPEHTQAELRANPTLHRSLRPVIDQAGVIAIHAGLDLSHTGAHVTTVFWPGMTEPQYDLYQVGTDILYDDGRSPWFVTPLNTASDAVAALRQLQPCNGPGGH